jgi:hypothetical protein
LVGAVLWVSSEVSWWWLLLGPLAYFGPAVYAALPADALAINLYRYRWLLCIAAFLLTLVLTENHEAGAAFHSAAAQVIPILVLALALEARMLGLRMQDHIDRGLSLPVLAFIGLGEYKALAALVADEPAPIDQVSGAIAAGFVAVVLTGLIGTIDPDNYADDRRT